MQSRFATAVKRLLSRLLSRDSNGSEESMGMKNGRYETMFALMNNVHWEIIL